MNRVAARLLPLVVLFALPVTAANHGYAQNRDPIIKRNLLASLEDCKERNRKTRCTLKVSGLIKSIRLLKVNFRICPSVEAEIRQAGDFLGTKGIEELLAELKQNYRRAPNELGYLVSTLGDGVLDARIRIIHASINAALQLDTGYKFIDDDCSNGMYIRHLIDQANYPDGVLVLGKGLMIKLRNPSLENDATLYLIISHEMAHAMQRKKGHWGPSKDGASEMIIYRRLELQADFIAGWWVSRYLRTTKESSLEYGNAFINMLNFIFSKGRVSDSDDSHQPYGTGKERLDAVNAGFSLKNETDPDRVFDMSYDYVVARIKPH